MKKVLLGLFLCSFLFMNSQNKPVLYGFDNIPQGLLLNPGQENSNKYHFGLPLLSGISFDANISTITVADVFRDDGIGVFSGTDINDKVDEALSKIGNKDYASLNAQIEVVSGGYRLPNQDYLSFGFYEEADVFVGFPKDVLTLVNEGNGNANIGRVFSVSGIAVKADFLGVLHAGITRRFNNRVTAGARFKVYSGAINVTSNNNQGTFITTLGNDGIYSHTFNNLDGSLQTSGIVNADESDVEPKTIIGNTFLSRNIGLGFDIGLTYHVNEQIELTASLLDVGFVSYSKNTENTTVSGNYSFSGIDFDYNGTTDFYQELIDDFNEKVTKVEDKDSYTVLRPVKFNSSVRYSFGKSRYLANCHDIRKKDYYDNAVGGQLYAVARPYGIRMAFTGFYERKFAKFLNTKVTYTIDDFSASNIGLGVSTNFWKMNVYGTATNIFKLADISQAHTSSLNFGVNFIFN